MAKISALGTLSSTAISIAALTKITHVQTDHLVAQIQIGMGLWITILGYCAMAVASVLGTIALCFLRGNK